MTDRPIIFSGPMVRALLDGRKTQTRRLATSPLRRCEAGDRLWVRETCRAEELHRPPVSRPTNRKERAHLGRTSVIVCDELDGSDGIRFAADDTWSIIENSQDAADAWLALFHYGFTEGERPKGHVGKSVPSIHMPRWASRLTLIVEAVRVEKLQAISSEDAIAEGVVDTGRRDGAPYAHCIVPGFPEVTMEHDPESVFAGLWEHLHGEGSWIANPDVLVLTFRVERGNIDRLPAPPKPRPPECPECGNHPHAGPCIYSRELPRRR